MLPKCKLPPKQTTIQFLNSSHFTIGNEQQWLPKNDPLAYRTTIKQHYPPKFGKKTNIAKMPSAAAIMHKGDAVQDQLSVTHTDFVKRNNTVKVEPFQALTKTNFKMDKDDRITSFKTTQESCYSSGLNKYIKSSLTNAQKTHVKSHIPQGDPEKEEWPDSEHKCKFYSRGFVKRRKSIPNDHLPKTIQGDERSHAKSEKFNTTSKLKFPPYECRQRLPIADQVKYPESNVKMCGEEPLPIITTQRHSFDCKTPSYVNFDRTKILENLRKTTFKNGDKRYDKFQTTNQYYLTHKVLPDPRNRYTRRKKSQTWTDVNTHSSPSETMVTSTRSHYKAPPKKFRNEIVDCSDYHTASVVCFGTVKPRDYQTTTKESFQPVFVVKYKKPDVRKHMTDNIPLDFYGDDLVSDTSYMIDFLKKRAIKRNAFVKLKNSHIVDPYKGLRLFNTTNGDTFTPKQFSRVNRVDIGLQKSDVPIGTIYSY